jgi:hypothetical protein
MICHSPTVLRAPTWAMARRCAPNITRALIPWDASRGMAGEDHIRAIPHFRLIPTILFSVYCTLIQSQPRSSIARHSLLSHLSRLHASETLRHKPYDSTRRTIICNELPEKSINASGVRHHSKVFPTVTVKSSEWCYQRISVHATKST